jgi:hypothetical protein
VTDPPKPASPPWHGALVTAMIVAGFGWLLLYTLLSVPAALGPWNYAVGTGLATASFPLVALWRGTPYTRPTTTTPPRRPLRRE